jgi:hypothetical protein
LFIKKKRVHGHKSKFGHSIVKAAMAGLAQKVALDKIKEDAEKENLISKKAS